MQKQIFFFQIILTFILLFNITLYSQKQGNIWYFGRFAGVDFNSGKPVALKDGQLNTLEGCATISDAEGKLLFYTDGISVWNKNHTIMPNGKGLYGDPSSTQSGVIIPSISKNNIFYVFTVDCENGAGGFCYSVVDTEQKEGLGDVIKKNTRLADNVTEKITAVRHRNNKDIWVIAHKFDSNEFLSFLITENGVDTIPVITKIGKIHGSNLENTLGYMKASPDGTNIAVAISDIAVEIFDFNNSSGELSNTITLPVSKYVYGIEFSPSGAYLYVSGYKNNAVLQYYLHAGSPEKIINSRVQINDSVDYCCSGALQLAPDGKIYYTIHRSGYLSAIEYPDKAGRECNFNERAVYLLGKQPALGLPTFYQSYFEKIIYDNDISYFDETKKVETGKTIILKDILFDFNKSTLRPSSYKELKKFVRILKLNPTYKVELAGHTDNIGNKSYNIDLSEKRTKSVGKYLISQGIKQSRISYKGYGSSKPIVSNADEKGRQKNRRVEFTLLK